MTEENKIKEEFQDKFPMSLLYYKNKSGQPCELEIWDWFAKKLKETDERAYQRGVEQGWKDMGGDKEMIARIKHNREGL